MKAENRQSSSCTDELDRELLRRFKSGDETAFVELLEIHSPLILYWVSLALKEANWANPHDLRQEAHFGVFEAAQRYKFSKRANFHALARIRAWGRMIDSPEVRIVGKTLYHNHSDVIDAHARLTEESESRPSLVELALEAKLSVRQVETAIRVDPFPTALEDNDKALAREDSDKSQMLSDAIAQLSLDQAEVMTRRYSGDKLWEIAKALGKSEEAVKKLHQRGKRRIKEILGKGTKKDGT